MNAFLYIILAISWSVNYELPPSVRNWIQTIETLLFVQLD